MIVRAANDWAAPIDDIYIGVSTEKTQCPIHHCEHRSKFGTTRITFGILYLNQPMNSECC